MRLLSVLYVSDHRAKISTSKGALYVSGEAGKQRVPLEALEAVVLCGGGQITTEAMAACVDRQVRVTALRRNGSVRFAISGGTSGNVNLRVAQLRAFEDDNRRAELATWFVAGKLQNAARMLRRWGIDARGLARIDFDRYASDVLERLSRLPGTLDGDRIRGIEGEATKRYFRGLDRHLIDHCSNLRFAARTRRPPRDPVNAALGFAYGLLTAEVRGALESVGLDPQVGYLHGLRPGRPALALDVLEEFRPSLADRFVVRCFTRRQLTAADFFERSGACYLTNDGRTKFLRLYEAYKSEEIEHLLLRRPVPRAAVPVVQATVLARHLRGDLPAYAPYVLAA